MSLWRTVGPALDLATALSAAFNTVYFLGYLALRRGETPSHRLAAAALALVSLGAMVESLSFLAFLALPATGSPLGSLPWALARTLPLIGTAFVSLLILRRIITVDP